MLITDLIQFYLYRELRAATFRLGIPRTISRIRSAGQKNAVFIWIPKTAGSSLWMFLTQFHCPKLRSPFEVKYGFCQRGWVTFGHQSYQELVHHGYVSQAYDASAFTFSFVRNPYARAVSLFFYFKEMEWIHPNLSFKTFLYILKDRTISAIGLYHIKDFSQCNPQVEWLLDEHGRIFVDFVGRVEHLPQDFSALAKRLGITGELPHLNRTAHDHYLDYYDEESRNIVQELYGRDFDLLGYPWDGDASQPVSSLRVTHAISAAS
jgi:hypothetical protein